MMRTFRLILLALPLAGTAAAQGDPRLSRLDPRTRASVVQVIDSLVSTGIPSEPLIDKALEGRAKGAPGPRIVAAVRSWGLDLARVRGAIGTTAREPELIAGASALRAGIDPASLRSLATARAGQDLLLPLTVMTDLAAAGMPADSAARVVIGVAERGGSDDELRAVQRGDSRGQGRGRPATAGPGNGNSNGQGRPPRTVPNKKGKVPGQGNGNGNGNGNPSPHP